MCETTVYGAKLHCPHFSIHIEQIAKLQLSLSMETILNNVERQISTPWSLTFHLMIWIIDWTFGFHPINSL